MQSFPGVKHLLTLFKGKSKINFLGTQSVAKNWVDQADSPELETFPKNRIIVKQKWTPIAGAQQMSFYPTEV